ncbi:AAA family ATPase [Enterobacteriaceae bacterium H20N1]|uniref:AAA family ATPase n=1 Tax=Dryocola boscaweniae TaxID=2925397 RepID=A0A9X2W9B2_9ENTR|nr:AAA family ATPase [Dryocola boscaweniae]MCT4703245.1 AAA family ATPase [Dryocola boscaweniae]MCT4720413.1 AAA family ATPase [Dryocola boscaweniae]
MSKSSRTQGKTVVLVNGVPASGKSTVARLLSEHFALPVLTIDGIKEPFMAQFDEIDRPFNRRLGCAAYDVIWSIVADSPTQCVFIIDAWFGFQPKEALERYLDQAGIATVLEVWNQIPGSLATARYAQRLDVRRPGHPGEEYLPELLRLADSAQPMALGPVYTVDQSHPLDTQTLLEWLGNKLDIPQHALRIA